MYSEKDILWLIEQSKKYYQEESHRFSVGNIISSIIIPIIMKRTEVKKANVHQFDIEELACRILGIDYDEIDADTEIINEELYNQFETDLDNFQDIVNRLLPLIDVGESPITKEKYKGFSTGNSWLAKVPV